LLPALRLPNADSRRPGGEDGCPVPDKVNGQDGSLSSFGLRRPQRLLAEARDSLGPPGQPPDAYRTVLAARREMSAIGVEGNRRDGWTISPPAEMPGPSAEVKETHVMATVLVGFSLFRIRVERSAGGGE